MALKLNPALQDNPELKKPHLLLNIKPHLEEEEEDVAVGKADLPAKKETVLLVKKEIVHQDDKTVKVVLLVETVLPAKKEKAINVLLVEIDLPDKKVTNLVADSLVKKETALLARKETLRRMAPLKTEPRKPVKDLPMNLADADEDEVEEEAADADSLTTEATLKAVMISPKAPPSKLRRANTTTAPTEVVLFVKTD
jgi:hypothetical protein